MSPAAGPIWEVGLHTVLHHGRARFTLDVRFASPARRLVLHGPSGAGKTQTMLAMAGLMQPGRGLVRIAGRTLLDTAAGVGLTPQQRRLAVVFQDYALFPHLTVRQNVAFARRAGWLNPRRDVVDASVDRWIAALQLGPVQGQLPHQLSGGQRQRAALARALVLEPAALLLDEPFAALDRALRADLRGELADLQAAHGWPMLLITHDEEDVEALADAVVELRDGRVARPAHGPDCDGDGDGEDQDQCREQGRAASPIPPRPARAG